jgi:hypothetical protein
MNRRSLFSFLSMAPAAAAAGIATQLTPKPTKLDVGNYEISAENDELRFRRSDVESVQMTISLPPKGKWANKSRD